MRTLIEVAKFNLDRQLTIRGYVVRNIKWEASLDEYISHEGCKTQIWKMILFPAKSCLSIWFKNDRDINSFKESLIHGLFTKCHSHDYRKLRILIGQDHFIIGDSVHGAYIEQIEEENLKVFREWLDRGTVNGEIL